MDDGPPSRLDRLGPLFASIWLFFLLNPLLDAWALRDEARGVVGLFATVAFAAAYLSLWVRARSQRARLVEVPSARVALAYLAPLVVLCGVMVVTVGEQGLTGVVYIAVACVMVLPARLAAVVVAVLVGGSLALSAVEDWGSQVGLAFAVMASSIAVFGMRTVMRRNIELVRIEQENAHLAVENERTRFARDLHDILGHSLTVITVKAELAQRLLDVDPERARAELADVERLGRDALADVREAVSGYRRLTLPGELTRARAALAAAEIEARLPGSADEVPSELRELFAWTIREGVTNVVRHSGARCCEVVLSTSAVEVRDDGPGPAAPGSPGSGLAGLRERAAALDATVVVRRLEPGFSLQVVRA